MFERLIICAIASLSLARMTDVPHYVEKPVIEYNAVTEESLEIQQNSAMYCESVEMFQEETEAVKQPVSLGVYRLTAYCSCHKCCGRWADGRPLDEYGNEIIYGASGQRLTAGYSIATDPNVLPYGTKVWIDGNLYESMDCGLGIDGACIDVYFSNHEGALAFGMQYKEIFLEVN